MIELLTLLLLPLGLIGIYVLTEDPQKSAWKKIHKIMKSGRLNKVANKALK